MKNVCIFLLLTSYFLLPSALAGNKIAQLAAVRQPAFHPPTVKGVTLSNGMTCYLLEDHSIPIMQGIVLIKGGDVYEDLKKTGVGSVMAGLLKDGGTAKHSPDKIRELLDENAIDISFSISSESIEGYFGALSKDTDTALALFFEMLFEPAFDREALSVIKKRIVDGLKRERDISGPVARKKFRELVYGKKNPWGKLPAPSVIKKISGGDVVEFYNRFFSPDKMIMAIAGDFERGKLLNRLEEFAGVYKARAVQDISPPPVTAADAQKTKFISRKFTQSAINIGHLGSTRGNPDKFALVILNDIFGGSGSFTNRLQDTVRVKGGLAYEVWSAYSFGPANAPGIFQVHAKTKNETTTKAVEIIRNEIARIVEGGVTKEEFKKAKDGILNSLIFEYERPFNIVTAIARFVYFGYPENYIDVYKRGIEKTTLDEVNAAAKKYLHPDKLKIVVVGRKVKS